MLRDCLFSSVHVWSNIDNNHKRIQWSAHHSKGTKTPLGALWCSYLRLDEACDNVSRATSNVLEQIFIQQKSYHHYSSIEHLSQSVLKLQQSHFPTLRRAEVGCMPPSSSAPAFSQGTLLPFIDHPLQKTHFGDKWGVHFTCSVWDYQSFLSPFAKAKKCKGVWLNVCLLWDIYVDMSKGLSCRKKLVAAWQGVVTHI